MYFVFFVVIKNPLTTKDHKGLHEEHKGIKTLAITFETASVSDEYL
jgi:hypothetical protein